MPPEGTEIVPEVAGAILAAAAKLFGDRGYDAASVREVAAAAGVAKPAIYYYFESKEGLLAALVRSSTVGFAGRLKEINAAEGVGARWRLEEMVSAFFDFSREHSDLMRFIYNTTFGAAHQPAHEAIMRGFDAATAEYLSVMRRAVDEGLMDAGGVEAAALALRGVTMLYCVEYQQGTLAPSPAHAAEIVEGCLVGYGRKQSESERK